MKRTLALFSLGLGTVCALAQQPVPPPDPSRTALYAEINRLMMQERQLEWQLKAAQREYRRQERLLDRAIKQGTGWGTGSMALQAIQQRISILEMQLLQCRMRLEELVSASFPPGP